MTPEQEKALVLARARRRREQDASGDDKSYTGSILPFSVDAEGNKQFDIDAGLIGSIKRAITLPGEAMRGEVDPTSPEGIARAFEFAATVSPMNPAVRAGDRAIPGVLRAPTKPIEPPTALALKNAAKEGYETLKSMPVDYKTSAVNNLAGEIQANLTNDGIITELAPKTYAILGKLSENPEGSVASLAGLEAARRTFANAAKDFANPTEQLAAKRAMESLDQFLARSDPATVHSGDPSGVGDLLRTARGNYSAAKRSEALTNLDDAAQLRANAANSGQNAGNTTRQRIASLLLNDKQAAKFGKEDLAELRGVNEGSRAANATRKVGNVFGGGGGLGQMAAGAAGAAVGSVFGPTGAAVGAAALPGLGRLSRAASNKLTEKALQQVERNTRKRSPLYEEMLKQGKGAPALPNKTVSAIRAMLLGLQANGGGGW